MRINCLFICPDSVSRADMVLQSCYARCGYGFGSHITQKTGIILSTVAILGAFGGDILVDVLAMTDPTYMKQIFYFTQNDYGFYQLLLGIGLFIIFLKAKITYCPWINTVASTTFGTIYSVPISITILPYYHYMQFLQWHSFSQLAWWQTICDQLSQKNPL